jgi:putative transposase
MDRNNFEEIPEGLWKQLSKVLPVQQQGARRGRPRIENRRVMAGIMFRLRTGCQWKAIPRHFGSGSTCHRRFQQWQQAGMFRAIFTALVGYYDRVCGIDWQWASLDSATVKAPKGGDCTGPNPTDRAKLGVKRHVLTDGRGVPVAIGISAANVHDKRLAEPMMDAVVVRQGPAAHRPQHLCLDKGYDYPDVEAAVRRRGICPHIRRRGEPKRRCRRGRARRWVVERTNAWHNRYRCILIRWERKAANYCALVHLACSVIAYQQATALASKP